MAVGGVPVKISLEVPSGAVRPRELLPVFRAVAETVVRRGVEEATRGGGTVSCRKGCGACCRQLVPLAPVEAAAIAHLVDALPEPRREAVRQRFREARARLAAEGLAERLGGTSGPSSHEEVQELGLAYFRLGIPCPFLEDESCSIHPDRPIACREYLVTSPASECSRPSAAGVRTVPVGRGAWLAVGAAMAPPGTRRTPWVALTLALAPELSEASSQLDEPRPAEEVVEAFLRQLGSPGRRTG